MEGVPAGLHDPGCNTFPLAVYRRELHQGGVQPLTSLGLHCVLRDDERLGHAAG
jgi:hypothetical protein